MSGIQRSIYGYLTAVTIAVLLFFSASSIAADVVNINRADAATMIENWKGIGEIKARAIVSYRKKNGNFTDIDDLLNVTGIGEGLIKKNRRYMSVSKGLTKPSGKVTTSSSKKSSSKKSTSNTSTAKSKNSSSKSTKSKSRSESDKKSSKKSKKQTSKKTECTSKSKDKKCKKAKKKKSSTT